MPWRAKGGPAPFGSAVIGPDGCFTAWAFDVVRALAAGRPGRPVLSIDRHDDVSASTDSRPIYLTNYPSRSLIDAIECGDVDVVHLLEDPVDSVDFLMRHRGNSLIKAIRAATATGVAEIAISRSRATARIARWSELRPGELIARIGEALGLDPNIGRGAGARLPPQHAAESIEAALKAHAPTYEPPLRARPDAARWPIATATSVLDPLAALGRGDGVRPIVWPTEVFLSGDKPDHPVPPVAAVAGPPRTLYYGPYFHLPPARYRVELVMGFSPEVADVPFLLEMHANYCLARVRIDRRQSREYRGYFVMNHTDPIATLEIRLRNAVAVAAGHTELIELRFFVT